MHSKPGRPRLVLGVPLNAQSVALIAVTLLFMALIGMAVLSWLERLE